MCYVDLYAAAALAAHFSDLKKMAKVTFFSLWICFAIVLQLVRGQQIDTINGSIILSIAGAKLTLSSDATCVNPAAGAATLVTQSTFDTVVNVLQSQLIATDEKFLAFQNADTALHAADANQTNNMALLFLAQISFESRLAAMSATVSNAMVTTSNALVALAAADLRIDSTSSSLVNTNLLLTEERSQSLVSQLFLSREISRMVQATSSAVANEFLRDQLRRGHSEYE